MTITPLLDPARILADLVTEAPSRAAVLDRFGLDYCCHGQRPLGAACADAGVPVIDVVAALAVAGTDAAAGDVPTEPGRLARHIEVTHHGYLRDELPALAALADKVSAVHRSRHPELADVARLVARIGSDLPPHLAIEEETVFPASREPEPGADLLATVEALRDEHDALGELLAELRTITGDYAVPADGCASYRSLYTRLAQLEADTHVHVHLENNVLFPAITAVRS